MEQTRRDFLKTAAAGSAVLTASSQTRVLGANDRINVGIIGVGGQGTSHLNTLIKRADDYKCKVAGVCDVYRRWLACPPSKSYT